jgi:molecular chaperone HscB
VAAANRLQSSRQKELTTKTQRHKEVSLCSLCLCDLTGSKVNEQVKTSETENCWNCSAQVTEHFCSACQKIQSLNPGVDYFAFFEIPRRFNIDSTELEHRFYDLSRMFHPDFFSNCNEAERQFSMDRSSKLNDAYRTLKEPNRRARYLLELEGKKIGEGRGKAPPDLLAEVFELNEEMEELRIAKQTQARNEIEQLKRRVLDMEAMLDERASNINKSLQSAFDKWDSLPENSSERGAVLDEVNELLMHLSYINNLIDDIEDEL